MFHMYFLHEPPFNFPIPSQIQTLATSCLNYCIGLVYKCCGIFFFKVRLGPDHLSPIVYQINWESFNLVANASPTPQPNIPHTQPMLCQTTRTRQSISQTCTCLSLFPCVLPWGISCFSNSMGWKSKLSLKNLSQNHFTWWTLHLSFALMLLWFVLEFQKYYLILIYLTLFPRLNYRVIEDRNKIP